MSKIITDVPHISKPRQFDKVIGDLEKHGKLDRRDFNNGAEIGATIDFYNDRTQKSHDKYASNEIIEISKLLARLQSGKTFIPSATSKSQT